MNFIFEEFVEEEGEIRGFLFVQRKRNFSCGFRDNATHEINDFSSPIEFSGLHEYLRTVRLTGTKISVLNSPLLIFFLANEMRIRRELFTNPLYIITYINTIKNDREVSSTRGINKCLPIKESH